MYLNMEDHISHSTKQPNKLFEVHSRIKQRNAAVDIQDMLYWINVS